VPIFHSFTAILDCTERSGEAFSSIEAIILYQFHGMFWIRAKFFNVLINLFPRLSGYVNREESCQKEKKFGKL